ncbi:hypothetical protein [Nonomuraea gerenzanensis]|uniref:hypothetical protein n=1 Tax=Nonomuraea gerenzanensis TaxID=93944 RepID=UPI001CD98422|nr:hypothetical protein [Nonomuraea gerenzanensis]UBU18535.1 hypothetical protein LCN96_26990 [Nonomuraea gerenzanensis]
MLRIQHDLRTRLRRPALGAAMTRTTSNFGGKTNFDLALPELNVTTPDLHQAQEAGACPRIA